NSQMRSVFSRNALSMVWDYAEANIFSNSTGSYLSLLDRMVKGFSGLAPFGAGRVAQLDARQAAEATTGWLVSTDPPYYDNVPYADLSDFFHVWLRQCLQPFYPDVLGTLLVPKCGELVADPHRHGGREQARVYFEEGMECVLKRFRQRVDSAVP